MSSKVPLGEVAKFINGRAFKPSDWGSKGLPIIRIQNLTNEEALFNYYNKDVEEQYYVKDGDLLISWSATLDVFIWNRGDAILNQHIFRAIPDTSKISKMFLFYALKYVMDDLRAQTHGATMKHITRKPFEQTKIFLPPLPEQERIVRLLDEAESLRATRERANVRMEQFVPALFQEMFGDPGTNAKGWQVSKIGNLLLLSPNYGSMIPVRNNNGEWINLRVANIQNGTLDLTDTKYIDLPDESIARHTVQDGDLLLARAIGSREHLGKCIVVYPGNNKWAFDSHMMRVRPNQEKILPLFLHAFLTSSGGRDIFLQNTRQSAVQFNINTKEFTSIQIPVPPLALQREFAARVEEARGVQSAQEKSTERVEALYQSMLSRAFAGEL